MQGTSRTHINRTLTTLFAMAVTVAAAALAAQPGRAQSPETDTTAERGTTPERSTTAVAPERSIANECRGRPGAAPPAGRHWFYRLERSTGKRCWYLGDEKTKVRRAASVERKAVERKSIQRKAVEPKKSAMSPPANSPPRQSVADDPLSDANETTAVVPTTSGTAPTRQIASFDWPATPAVNAEDKEAAPVETSGMGHATDAADTRPDMPLVWPVLTSSDLAAEQLPQSPAIPTELLVLFIVLVAFIAVAVVAASMLMAARRRNRVQVTPEPIHADGRTRSAFDATAAPADDSGLGTAAWYRDSLLRAPATPHVFDAMSVEEPPALRRRRAMA